MTTSELKERLGLFYQQEHYGAGGEPQSIEVIADIAVAHAEQLEAENKRLRKLLGRTHAAWMFEASQGDGIMKEHRQVDLDCRAAFAEREGT